MYPIKNLIAKIETKNSTNVPVPNIIDSADVKTNPNFNIFNKLLLSSQVIPIDIHHIVLLLFKISIAASLPNKLTYCLYYIANKKKDNTYFK